MMVSNKELKPVCSHFLCTSVALNSLVLLYYRFPMYVHPDSVCLRKVKRSAGSGTAEEDSWGEGEEYHKDENRYDGFVNI